MDTIKFYLFPNSTDFKLLYQKPKYLPFHK